MKSTFKLLVISFLFVKNIKCCSLSSASSCSSFTVSSCSPDQDELVDSFPFPPNTKDGAALCQQTCGIFEGCQFFTFNSVSGYCDLYHYRYLESCQVVGGPAVPAMDDCMEKGEEDSCESFIEEDC